MECFAGLAAATGVGTKEVFDYNRENFLYDRRLRLKKELKLQQFKIEQGSLWREDVRDLISLTEYKMHVYLLVNVLMLGFTVILYCEGKLPSHTPTWLMMGYLLAITGSFMFLLLSIWMAMQAAVAAQSYEARLLTQMVRLPLPTWAEVEACRTYASEFEQTEPRQMFRVPWVFGRQERLVPSPPAQDPAAARSPASPGGVDSDAMSVDSVEADASSVSSRTNLEAGMSQQASADPWGLERRGDKIYELGCKKGHEVAQLRHILLARRAMVYWQTYDAFARVCLSIGANQLLLALSYYLIGYIMVEVGCPMSAGYGVLLLTAMTETLSRLDMSLTPGQLRFLQFLLLVGPTTSCLAGYHWTKQSSESSQTAEALIVISFFAHAMYLALMNHFSRIRPQDNGAMLPAAFRSVLYLDVFGWLKAPHSDDDTSCSEEGFDDTGESTHSSGAAARASFYAAEYPGVEGRQPPDGELEHEAASPERPALAALRYENGRPVPCRPEDVAPQVQDFRALPEAPQPKRNLRDCEETEFFRAASWLQAVKGPEDLEAETGHEKQPGLVPWIVFSAAMRALCLAWLASALYHGLGASQIWTFDDHGPQLLQTSMVVVTGRSRSAPPHPASPEAISVTWPYLDLQPKSMACDASGHRFVVSDGIALYAATLQQRNITGQGALRLGSQASAQPKVAFEEAACPAVLGEGLQDVAVVCNYSREATPTSCASVVLHQQGQRISLCTGAHDSNPTSMSVATNWLERIRPSLVLERAGDTQNGVHGQVEKPVSVAFDQSCEASDAAGALNGCSLLGTTRGRVVQMRRHGTGSLLVPSHGLREQSDQADPPLRAGGIRTLKSGQLAMLTSSGSGVQVLRMDGRGSHGLEIPAPDGKVAAFCVGGDHIYMLGQGASPSLWRVRLPASP